MARQEPAIQNVYFQKKEKKNQVIQVQIIEKGINRKQKMIK